MTNRRAAGWISPLLLAIVPALYGCPGPPDAGAAPPAPETAASMELAPIVQADTFTVVATWPAVVFAGDTIRTYQRTLTRTDTTGVALDDSIAAIGSETVDLASPAPGATGSYRYCLRSRNDFGLSTDSACAAFQYTNPDTLPPPPDSVTVDTQLAIAVDSLTLDPEDTTIVVGDSYQLRARLWKDGEVVGCAGRCGSTTISAAKFVRHVPLYLKGRPGYWGEWVAARLPWIRPLASG